MTEFENDKNQQHTFAQANPSPVLSSGADGVLQFVNASALKLKHNLELERAEDLLPVDHEGLVKACLKTGITLTENSQLGDRNLVWSYKPTDESDVVYIYGYDVTDLQPKNSSLGSLPETNPNPVLIYEPTGAMQFSNVAVAMLLVRHGLDNVLDILPVNHEELMKTCLKTGVSVTEERQTSGCCIIWSYQLPDADEVIYIYGYDVSNLKSGNLPQIGLPNVNPSPVLTSDPDGVLQYSNHATSLLLLDLELDNIEEMLPCDHRGLVKACHSTSTPLSDQCQLGDRTLVWSYLPVQDSDVIYIYGYDITDYCSDNPGKER